MMNKVIQMKNSEQLRTELHNATSWVIILRAVIAVLLVVLIQIIFKANEYSAAYDELLIENQRLELELQELRATYDIEHNLTKIAVEQLQESCETVDALTSELETVNKELEAMQNYIDVSISAPEDRKYTRNTDLGVHSVMTADRMDRIIDYWLDRNNGSDSPFKNQGQAFINASQKSGLDPVFIFAIASHESNYGRSNIARSKHNYMGIGAYDSSPYTSALTLGSSFEEAITANAMWVADKYYNQGQTTLNSMIYGGKMYSSSKDKWINGINSIMSASATID